VILLEGQTKAAEDKERNIGILHKKTAVFQGYINTVWKIWMEQKVTANEFEELTTGYYKDIMLYLDDKKPYESDKRKPSKIIADCISNIAKHLYKTINRSAEKEDLRNNIILIINVLSDQIGLGGKIQQNIIARHDKEMFPATFRQAILDDFNTFLVKPNAELLEEGYWDEWEEDNKFVWDMMEFPFKKNPECSMIFGYTMDPDEWSPKTRQFEAVMFLPRGSNYGDIRKRGKERADLYDKDSFISRWDTPIEFFCFYDEKDTRVEAIREKGTYLDISRDLAHRAAEFFSSAKVADTGNTIAEYVKKQFGGKE
jgi:hypothetical protein